MTYPIAPPVQGQPVSSSLFGQKVIDAITDMDLRIALREAQLELPASVTATAGGAGTNTCAGTANVWNNLPTNALTASITNPSDIFNLRCLVFQGAWLDSDTGTIRFGINITGGVVSDPNPGTNSAAGWGMVPHAGVTGSVTQHSGAFQLLIPAGAAAVNFTGQYMRSSASGTQQVNYATLEVVPWRYELP